MSVVHMCDLCGRQMSIDDFHNSYFKIKKLQTLWWDSTWVTIEAHNECVQELMDKAYARKMAQGKEK